MSASWEIPRTVLYGVVLTGKLRYLKKDLFYCHFIHRTSPRLCWD